MFPQGSPISVSLKSPYLHYPTQIPKLPDHPHNFRTSSVGGNKKEGKKMKCVPHTSSNSKCNSTQKSYTTLWLHLDHFHCCRNSRKTDYVLYEMTFTVLNSNDNSIYYRFCTLNISLKSPCAFNFRSCFEKVLLYSII